MHRFRTALFPIFTLLFLGSAGYAHAEVSPSAYEVTEIFGLPITNSMLTSWVIVILLVIAIRLAVGAKPKLIPTRPQMVVESLVQGIMDLIRPIVGSHMVKPTFPLLIGLFTFILIQNWSGLLPGVGTIGHYDAEGHFIYWIRPANADLNMTLALALISFGAWLYFIFRYAGPRMVAYDIFGNKADKKEVPLAVYYPLFIIFIAVGFIEIISILFRPVSLSFRLFGNVFGGENLLVAMTELYPWILPIPFYALEMLIGLIQALVFTLLSAVYIGLICNHGEEHAEAEAH